MRITQVIHELDVKDFEAMVRAYLKIPETSRIDIRIDGADFSGTFEDITVVIEHKK